MYTYTLLLRLSRYVLYERYNITNNRVDNVIRPLAIAERTSSSAATTTPLSGQPLSIPSSTISKCMTSMFVHGLSILSKESRQKRTLNSYFFAYGRYYPLIAGNNQLLCLIAATTGDFRVMVANCYLYVLGRMLTNETYVKF